VGFEGGMTTLRADFSVNVVLRSGQSHLWFAKNASGG
jgi:hypothetical protein